MLGDLDKATLRDIGVTAVCDVIRIVKHAKRLADAKLRASSSGSSHVGICGSQNQIFPLKESINTWLKMNAYD